MELNDFLKTLSLFQKLAPVEVTLFVHNHLDKLDEFFDFESSRPNTGNDYWNILVINMEEGWVVCHNIGAIDSMSISCASASNIRPPMPANYKLLLNHYFPGRSAILVYDVLESSHHDPAGMVGALLHVFCSIFRKPWANRHILDLETNVCTLKLILRTSVTSKSLPIFPPWVLRSPLDAESIVSPTIYEGLMSEEELNNHGQMNRMMRTNRAESRRELSERKRGATSILSRVSQAKPTNPEKELVGEELVRVREELDYFVLPESDEEEEPERDDRMDILLDIPSFLDGVSVSGFFKGLYSVLFEVNIQNEVEPLAQLNQGSRIELSNQLGAVEKAIRANKQRCYREKAKEKKEKEREKEDGRKERLDRVKKDKARVVEESGDEDLPIIDGISDVIVVGKKQIEIVKSLNIEPANLMNTEAKATCFRESIVKNPKSRDVNPPRIVPSHLDICNTPNITRDLVKPEIFQKILDGDTNLESDYRRRMEHFNTSVAKTGPNVFYNCLICNNYISHCFKRTISHSLNCMRFSKEVPYTALLANTDRDLSAMYKKAMYCLKCNAMSNRGHYHCSECYVYCSHLFKRVVKHGMNCKGTNFTTKTNIQKEKKQEEVDGFQEKVNRGECSLKKHEGIVEYDRFDAAGGSGKIINNVEKFDIEIQGTVQGDGKLSGIANYHEIQEVVEAVQGDICNSQRAVNRDLGSVCSVQNDVKSVLENVESEQEDVESEQEDVESEQEDVESVQEAVESEQEDIEIVQEDVESVQDDVEGKMDDVKSEQEDVESVQEAVESGEEDIESEQDDVECVQEEVENVQEDVVCVLEDVESEQEDLKGINENMYIGRGGDVLNQDKTPRIYITHSLEGDSNITGNCRACRAGCISEKGHIHYHCDVCNKHTHKSKSRVLSHVKKCLEKNYSVEKTKKLQQHRVLQVNEIAENLLQVVLVDPEKGIYLVRKSLRGPASPVHVLVDSNKGIMDCDNKECKEMATFSAHSLDPGAACRHIKSCQNAITEVGPDIFDPAKLCDTSFSKYSEDIMKIVEGAAVHQAPVAKIFVPDPKTDGLESTRHLYFSVFGNFSIKKYYSHFERVLLVFDRDTKKIKCYCNKDWCSHRKIVGAILESDKTLTSQRPEKVVDDAQVSKARKIAKYLIAYKKIPLNVTGYLKSTHITHFVPSEQECVYCNTPLEISSTNKRGFIFTAKKKISNVTISTKLCKQCDIEYRYSDYTDGYYNFNNSSIFALAFLEKLLATWVARNTVEGELEALSRVSNIEFNINLVMDALKAYLSLKNINDYEMSCNRCGYFPVMCNYDAVRKTNFDIDPEEFVENDDGDDTTSYSSFEELYDPCCIHDLARGILNKKAVNYAANLKSLSVKLYSHFPAFLSRENSGPAPPYTGGNVRNDRPEEIELPIERLESLLKGKNTYKELKKICDQFNINTRGGKSHIIHKITGLDNKSEFYSVIRKKFFSIAGKSGGLMRAICQHGVCNALKILTLPESVADFLSIMAHFKFPPTFNMCDSASLVSKHAENNIPGFFRPYQGRLDDFNDPCSELYKTGDKKAMFNFKLHTTKPIDLSKFDKDSAHPVSGLIARQLYYDRFHENNHNEPDNHLRRIDNTNLEGKVNTQACEQQNHLTVLCKSSLNEMDRNQFIKAALYLTAIHNSDVNSKWKKKVERQKKVKTTIDNLGFLEKIGVDKESLWSDGVTSQPSEGTASSNFPTATLMCNSKEQVMKQLVSDINALVYLVSFTTIGSEITASDRVDELFKKIAMFVQGISKYEATVHHRMCVRIGRTIQAGSQSNVTLSDLLESLLKVNLQRCKSKCTFGSMTSNDIGISVANLANMSSSGISDYLFLSTDRCRGMSASHFSGASSHFDLSVDGEIYRYLLEGLIFRRAGKNICAVRFKNGYYELFNSQVTLIKREQFECSSRVSSILMFKLMVSSRKQTAQNRISRKIAPKRPADEIQHDHFDFQSSEHSLPRKKIKISRSTVARVPPTPWLDASRSGRLELTSEQQKILMSPSQWYDDVIINSYSRMCKSYMRDTFRYQDTCLGDYWHSNFFTSVDGKFIQILNTGNNHWVTVSNALTFTKESLTVEVFDSLKRENSLSGEHVLDSEIARFVLQLRPNTSCVRYIKTQTQLNSNDCGPFALGFLWSLSRGQNPANFEYNLNPVFIRKHVHQTLSTDGFVPPTQRPPKNLSKVVLREYHVRESDGKFY